jgi:hypothetical protein
MRAKITGYAFSKGAFEDYRHEHCPALTKYIRPKEKETRERSRNGRSKYRPRADSQITQRPTAANRRSYTPATVMAPYAPRALRESTTIICYLKRTVTFWSASCARACGDRQAGIILAKLRRTATERSPRGSAESRAGDASFRGTESQGSFSAISGISQRPFVSRGRERGKGTGRSHPRATRGSKKESREKEELTIPSILSLFL